MTKPKVTRSRIWIGTFLNNNHVGWLCPPHIEPGGSTSLSAEQHRMLEGVGWYYPGDLYRCEVIIRPLKDKRGRYIMRRNKKKQP